MSVKSIGMFKNTIKYFLSIFLSISLNSCGGNILSEFADKESDPALLKAMQIHTNKFEWDDAISKYSQMSTEFASKREVLVVLASAYAGKCGLRFIELAQNIGDMGVTLLFKFLMRQFPNSTSSNRDDCKLAENAI